MTDTQPDFTAGQALFEVHDEVSGDMSGGRGYVVRTRPCAVQPADGTAVRFFLGKELELIRRPDRPLSAEDAKARFLTGWNVRCNFCGDHGAKWIRGERPGWGALALCELHEDELRTELLRHRAVMNRLRTIKFEQVKG